MKRSPRNAAASRRAAGNSFHTRPILSTDRSPQHAAGRLGVHAPVVPLK